MPRVHLAGRTRRFREPDGEWPERHPRRADEREDDEREPGPAPDGSPMPAAASDQALPYPGSSSERSASSRSWRARRSRSWATALAWLRSPSAPRRRWSRSRMVSACP